MYWIYRKINYSILLLSLGIVYSLTALYSLIFRRKDKSGAVKKIAAVWYYPKDMVGSNLRLGHWKSYFEKEGIQFDNYYLFSYKEHIDWFWDTPFHRQYLYVTRIIWKRFFHFLQMKNYDVVWIDRGFLPCYYSQTKAIFEKHLQRMVKAVVLDSTDGGDYQSNPVLLEDAIKHCDRMTVGFLSLLDFFSKKHPSVHWVTWTVPTDGYIVKTDESYAIKNRRPILGWMGSVYNYEYLADITPALAEVAKEIPFDLHIICRKDMGLSIPGVNVRFLSFDDYYHRLNEFDIGLCPYTVRDLSTTGKIGMKHQEFLMCGIPQVCSPQGISEFAVHGKEVFIADKLEEWTEYLKILLRDEEIRRNQGRESIKLFQKYYTYEAEFPKLFKALTEF